VTTVFVGFALDGSVCVSKLIPHFLDNLKETERLKRKFKLIFTDKVDDAKPTARTIGP
jgi:hypothetical protein